MPEDKPFNLVRYFPALTLDYVAESTNDWVINTAVHTQRYNWVNHGSGRFEWRDQMDIGGWTKEGLTAFFAAQYLQRPMVYGVSGSTSPNGGIEVIDTFIVSDEPIEDTPLLNGFANLGFPSTPDDYMNIKFYQGFDFVQTTTSPMAMTLSDSFSAGSGEPTASGTLYLARLITIYKDGAQANDQCIIPEYRYVASGIATEEPEFVYLNRLRRSFELRQS